MRRPGLRATGAYQAGTQRAGTGYDYATIAYDAVTGAQQWAKRWASPGNGDDSAYFVAVSPSDGTVLVTGNAGTATMIAYSG